MNKLLSREEFKKQVFDRDNHKCIFCGNPAEDAHHIMDRGLFKDGGYYLKMGLVFVVFVTYIVNIQIKGIYHTIFTKNLTFLMMK